MKKTRIGNENKNKIIRIQEMRKNEKVFWERSACIQRKYYKDEWSILKKNLFRIKGKSMSYLAHLNIKSPSLKEITEGI